MLFYTLCAPLPPPSASTPSAFTRPPAAELVPRLHPSSNVHPAHTPRTQHSRTQPHATGTHTLVLRRTAHCFVVGSWSVWAVTVWALTTPASPCRTLPLARHTHPRNARNDFRSTERAIPHAAILAQVRTYVCCPHLCAQYTPVPASNLRRACLPRAYAPPVSDTYTQDVDALSLPASAGSRSVYLLIPVYAAHIPAATLSSANHQTARHATRRGTCCAAEPPSTSSWLCYSNSNSRAAPPHVTPPFPQHTHTELRGASVDDDAFGGAAASSPP